MTFESDMSSIAPYDPLNEREKELACLYAVARDLQASDRSTEELLQKIADDIPPGFRFPEITAARIVLENLEIRTANFRETQRSISSAIIDNGKRIGFIQACYLEKRPEGDQGPFLAQEVSLLDGLAGLLGTTLVSKKAVAELRENQTRLASIYNTVADVIFHLAVEPDGNYRFVSANDAFFRVTGLPPEAVVGRTVNEVIPEPSLTMVLGKYRKAIAEKDVVRWEEVSDYPTGRLVGEVSVAPVLDEMGRCSHLVGTVHDITAHKRLERQLLEAQKMESIGRLAGGIAHDFNNYLTAIKGNIELAATELPKDSIAQDELKSAMEASGRAAVLARQLLLFGHREHMELVPTDLNHVVSGVISLLNSLVGESHRIVTDLTDKPSTVSADASHIEQVIMNLVVNARDAMPGGGEITISTFNEQLGDRIISGDTEPHAEDLVSLSVVDNGIGMDEETKSHMFEPFFTTKAKEGGTGLGLSVVYGIISYHGGWIDVLSTPGEGTTLKVYLPSITERSQAVAGDGPGDTETYQGRGEKILLVEDDAAIKSMAGKVLAGAGYRVLEAADAEAALEIFASEPDDIQLVFSDIVLPGMNGVDLIEHLRARKPDIHAIVASGYSDGMGWQVSEQEGISFLEKPYSMENVLRTIHDLLQKS